MGNVIDLVSGLQLVGADEQEGQDDGFSPLRHDLIGDEGEEVEDDGEETEMVSPHRASSEATGKKLAEVIPINPTKGAYGRTCLILGTIVDCLRRGPTTGGAIWCMIVSPENIHYRHVKRELDRMRSLDLVKLQGRTWSFTRWGRTLLARPK